MANRSFDRFIVVSFQDFDSESATPEECLAKLDAVCKPFSGTNPSFNFLDERGPENENLIRAVEKIVDCRWGEGGQDEYADDPFYVHSSELFAGRYEMA